MLAIKWRREGMATAGIKIPSFLFYLYLVLHPTYVAYVLVLHDGRAVL